MVVEPGGAPVVDARVTVRLRHALYREARLASNALVPLGDEAPDAAPPRWSTETDAAGAFRLDDAVGGAAAFLHVERGGFEEARLDLPDADALDLVVRLEAPEGARTLSGVVLDPAGAPVEGASVSAGDEVVATDAEGRFSLVWDPDRLRNAEYERGADGVFRARDVQTHLAAVHPGHAPARVELTRELAAAPLVLRLGERPRGIEGRVVDGDGEPVPGAVVWLRDLTPFGQLVHTENDATVRLSTTVEEHLAGGHGRASATASADGRFRLGGLLDRAYDLRAYDPRTASFGAARTVEAGARGVALVVPRDPSCRRVAGRVLSLDGAPLAGVSLRPVRSRGPGGADRPPQRAVRSAETDAEGRFAFEALAVEGTTLELQGAGLFLRWIDLAERDEPLDALELRLPLLGELHVALADPAAADGLRVLDAEGRPLRLLEPVGPYVAESDEASLTDGRSSVLLVEETARTLVLVRDGDPVTDLPLRITPGQRTEIRR